MNVPVEAQSLSALTTLLSNPPQYPRNPTHEVRDPLVLYIVRVPGSKDVFLTPLKPPTKASISLEAIQSSLYYLHVLTEKDDEIEESLAEEERRSEELPRSQPPIHRKPLPSTPHANYPPSQRPDPPPKSYPHHQPGIYGNVDSSQLERYQARGSNLNFDRTSQPVNSQESSKAATPRRFKRAEEEVPYQASTDTVQHARSDHDHEERPSYQRPLSFRSGRQSPSSIHLSYNDPSNRIGLHSDQYVNPLSASSFALGGHVNGNNRQITITLIRRDPVSGGQWNVGSISLASLAHSVTSLGPVSIMITTPGYSRFANAADFSHLNSSLSDAESIKEALKNGSFAVTDDQTDSPRGKPFTRLAEYQQQTINHKSFRLHRRTDSGDSLQKPPSPTKPARQVFSFLSPWHGLCTFSNGIDGSSLKCRHTLTSSFSPEEDNTAAVAELRFNLPWSLLPSNNDNADYNETQPISKLLGPRSGKEQIKRGLRNVKNFGVEVSKELRDRKSQDESYSLESGRSPLPIESDIDRLSLRLGREKAGGGFKGTSAKLGKLIIEDEGLKMCDLVVAACMGVWWQHYENTT